MAGVLVTAVRQQVAVVGGRHQPAAVAAGADLDAGRGAGGIPVPVVPTCHGADVAPPAPGCAVVIRGGEPYLPVAGSGEDIQFFLDTGAAQQMDASRVVVDDGTGVADLTVAVAVHHLDIAPGRAAVGGAAQDDVDVAEVAAGVAPSLGERQQGGAGGHGQDRTADGVVVAAALHARHPHGGARGLGGKWTPVRLRQRRRGIVHHPAHVDVGQRNVGGRRFGHVRSLERVLAARAAGVSSSLLPLRRVVQAATSVRSTCAEPMPAPWVDVLSPRRGPRSARRARQLLRESHDYRLPALDRDRLPADIHVEQRSAQDLRVDGHLFVPSNRGRQSP